MTYKMTTRIGSSWKMFLRSAMFLTACFAMAPNSIYGQAVCLPAPRLLTTTPMGGQVGTTVEVAITGDNFEDVEELLFSHPKLSAVPKQGANGLPVQNQFIVTIANDCPVGLHEARVMTRLGISSSRIFNVGTLSETVQVKPNTTIDKAMKLELNSICNGSLTQQAIDYYSFEAKSGQRVIVDCAAQGIDSKANAVLVVADENGNDLLVERRGGAIDFSVPADGKYTIKVHDLTFKGGAYYFYRLALITANPDELVDRLPSTQSVSSFSWPPAGLTDEKLITEAEPNNAPEQSQKIELPCDISGSFYPAADVDRYEFVAKKGDVWWVEVASERLGRPTDASIVVQHVAGIGTDEKVTDLIELTDIASPVKVSSNGYSYDGPPYNAGSPDILGKIEIKEDGVHRLQILDLFGGTRNDPRNIYRLIIRKAEPDFAVVAWALHMNLRNGDRNALSKPIALRGGTTMPIEVVVIRRDGFDGEIDLKMENLPAGVHAAGIRIPAGKSSGMFLVTAEENAPRALSQATFTATAIIAEQNVERTVHMASMAWPVPNAWSEIPSPRLMADIPVSVSGAEQTPLSIGASKDKANEDKVWEVKAGDKLTIPLTHTQRSDFSGSKISLKTLGVGFDKNPAFDAPLNVEASEATLDLAALKTPPGEYTIAFYGSAVAKYQYHPEAVTIAEAVLKQALDKATALAEETKQLMETAKSAMPEQKADIEKTAQEAAEKLKAAEQAVKVAEAQLKSATAKAAPKDIVDIIVSEPISIRVLPAEETK